MPHRNSINVTGRQLWCCTHLWGTWNTVRVTAVTFCPCSGVSMQDTSLAARGQSNRNRGRPKAGSKGGTGKGRSRKSIAGSAAAMAGAKAGAAAASAAAYAAYGYNVSKGTWGTGLPRAQPAWACVMEIGERLNVLSDWYCLSVIFWDPGNTKNDMVRVWEDSQFYLRWPWILAAFWIISYQIFFLLGFFCWFGDSFNVMFRQIR